MIIFYTKEKYDLAEAKICQEMGFPNNDTDSWSKERQAKIDNKIVWIMPKHPDVSVDFDDEQEYKFEWEEYKGVE